MLRLVGVRRHGLELDLVVDAGERVALVGPSGAGKSTVLRIAAGLERPDAGLVVAPPPRDVALLGPRDPLHAHLTVFENLAFALRLRHLPEDELGARVTAAADALGITALLGRRPGAISSGERQRVALAAAAARAPRLLLVDEPRADLADDLVRVHRVSGAATLAVTHDAALAARLGDRVIVLGQSGVGLRTQSSTSR